MILIKRKWSGNALGFKSHVLDSLKKIAKDVLRAEKTHTIPLKPFRSKGEIEKEVELNIFFTK